MSHITTKAKNTAWENFTKSPSSKQELKQVFMSSNPGDAYNKISSKLKKQLSYANSKKIEYVLLLGDEELKNEEFFLKNMNEGTQVCYKISQLESVVLSRLKK